MRKNIGLTNAAPVQIHEGEWSEQAAVAWDELESRSLRFRILRKGDTYLVYGTYRTGAAHEHPFDAGEVVQGIQDATKAAQRIIAQLCEGVHREPGEPGAWHIRRSLISECMSQLPATNL